MYSIATYESESTFSPEMDVQTEIVQQYHYTDQRLLRQGQSEESLLQRFQSTFSIIQ